MLLDFEVQRCTRRCAASDREIAPGETCYSVLEVQGVDVVRRDYAPDAWAGAPAAAIGWWQTTVPKPNANKVKLAPNDVLLALFDELAEQPERQDLRYVLTLLLVRRRVLRIEVLPFDSIPVSASPRLLVSCPRREATYEVPVVEPTPTRIDEIQQQLSDLLVAGAE